MRQSICKPLVRLSAVLALLMAASLAHAVECRAIPSVKSSGVSASNNAAGGHLNQHIYGATPPAGTSQVGKTLFTSVEEYTGFWNNYVNSRNTLASRSVLRQPRSPERHRLQRAEERQDRRLQLHRGGRGGQM